MTRPRPDDDRPVELDEEVAAGPAGEGWDGWEAGTGGRESDHDRWLRDEVPPHWG